MELAARTQDPAAQPGALGVALAVCMVCFAALLWTATTLSVVKPWGRTRWGSQDLEARRTGRVGSPAKTPHSSDDTRQANSTVNWNLMQVSVPVNSSNGTFCTCGGVTG